MATQVIQRVPVIVRGPKGALKVTSDPPKKQVSPVSPFDHSTHASLQVISSLGSPAPENVQVTVFDGSSGKRVLIHMRIPDTISILKQKFMTMRPEFRGELNLAFNGKPVFETSTLAELGVKTGAMFITYYKCIGG